MTNSLHLPRGRALLQPVDLFTDDAESVPQDLTGMTVTGNVYEQSGAVACPLDVVITDTVGGGITIGLDAEASADLTGNAYGIRIDFTFTSGQIESLTLNLHVTPF